MVNVLNSFYGGVSRDDTLFNQGEYVYADGFDITRYPWELRPMPTVMGITTIGTAASVWVPTFICLDWSDVTMGMSDGKIRKTDGTVAYDTTYWQEWIYSTYFGDSSNEYWIFLSNRVLQGTKTDSFTYSGFSSVFNGVTITKPVLWFWEMFFWAATNVKRVDTFGNITDVYENDLPSNTRVTWVTINWGYLRVYYARTNSGSDGWQLDIIDIGSLTVAYSVKLPFNPSSLVSANDFDFVLGGRDLYKCSGIQFQSLAEQYYSELTDLGTSWYIDGSKFSFTSGYNTMDYTNERLYSITNLDRYIIYGSKHDALPEVFCYGAYDWLNQAHEQIYAINVNKATEDMYVGFSDGSGNIKLWYIPHSTYTAWQNTVNTATIITPYYNFGDYSTLKQLEEIRIGMTSTGEADVYASIDGGAYELVDTIDQTVRGEKIMFYKKDFREISLKIVMSGIIMGRKITNIDIRFTPYGL